MKNPGEDLNKPKVMEVKQIELQNLFKYDVCKEVDDVGQERMRSR